MYDDERRLQCAFRNERELVLERGSIPCLLTPKGAKLLDTTELGTDLARFKSSVAIVDREMNVSVESKGEKERRRQKIEKF